jgi:hypothetical protein
MSCQQQKTEKKNGHRGFCLAFDSGVSLRSYTRLCVPGVDRMTTIAFRDGIMAADSQESNGDTKGHCLKLFQKKDEEGNETIIGTAGGSFSGMLYVEHFGTGKSRPEAVSSVTEDEDFHVLLWDGWHLYEVNRLWLPVRVPPCPFFAIGSGRAAALGAMHMGASAEEAVQVAKKIDNYTGGPVKLMAFWEE